MRIKSPAFETEERIPTKYTCDDRAISPPLEIKNVPSKAKSLVLIMDDPDSPNGTFVHWLMWNIPSEKTEVEEDQMADQEVEGTNDFGNVGYGGPCPGSGVHRYFFRLYALDITLKLPASTTRDELEEEMEEHILEEAELIGLYGK